MALTSENNGDKVRLIGLLTGNRHPLCGSSLTANPTVEDIRLRMLERLPN